MKNKLLILTAIITLVQCGPNSKYARKRLAKKFTPSFQSVAPTIVYKTKGDYSKNIPITLNAEKTEIIQYPHPKDIISNTKLLTPTALKNNYLLDNKGINVNTVFLKYTYLEYAALKEAPSLEDLKNSIIDNDPFVEICDCGGRTNIEPLIPTLNGLIETKSLLTKCKVIKK